MKILFYGSGSDSLIILKKLFNNKNFILCGCITKPAKPRGRGRHIIPTEVEQFCLCNNINVIHPLKLNSDEVYNWVKDLNPDIGVVASFGLYIPEILFSFPRLKTLNVHPSLLPEYRGAAPVRYVLFDNKAETGVTIHYTALKMDAGDILASTNVKIDPSDNYLSLSLRLFETGADLLIDVLNNIDNIKPQPQDDSKATYARVLRKDDFFIDWDQEANKILGKVRGLSPQPAAHLQIRNEVWKILKVEVYNNINCNNFSCGDIVISDVKKGLFIKCKDAVIRLNVIQRPGKRIMTDTELLKGYQPR
ncbi:MAG: methionyl-tRNA formyltransferase [Candidatus Hydrogenedentota bacterium]